jgi:hypothetical protein
MLTDRVENVTELGSTCAWSTFKRAGAVIEPIGNAPFVVELGQPVAGGTGWDFTTAVGTEVAVSEPAVFVAVSRTRRLLPLSTGLSVYVVSVAPLMAAQLPPSWSQRNHL